MNVAHLITLTALVVVLVCDVTFIVLNHMWTAWRSNSWGRHVMLFSYVLAAILLFGFARLVFGDYPGRRAVIALLYVVLAAVMLERLWLVLRPSGRLPRREVRDPEQVS